MAPVIVPTEERGQALTMLVALAAVLMEERGQALTVVVPPAAVLMGERGLVLKMVVAPTVVLMEERRVVLIMIVNSAPYLNPGRTAPILRVVQKPPCMRDIAVVLPRQRNDLDPNIQRRTPIACTDLCWWHNSFKICTKTLFSDNYYGVR